jgi:cell wall-associated NlpC family hydrolase
MSADPRTLLARPDLADERLEGLVRAERFVQTQSMRCTQAIAAIHEAPDAESRQADELLFGEGFEVLESKDGWAWGQSRRDGYVGFVRAEALGAAGEEPTHRVGALRTYGFSRPDLKSRVASLVSMNSLVRAGEVKGGYVDAGEAGWIYADHLRPIGLFETDPVAVAERFLGAPYLWGGRSSLGLDCSGLVQMAFQAVGRACPRDTDQQMAAFAEAPGRPDLVRGDLVFWRGHMGMMLDAERMIHANAFHMAVAVEPVDEAIARIRERPGLEVLGFRRP